MTLMTSAKPVCVLAHRGYWLKEEEKNTSIAFRRAFDLGFGIETDLRDIAGKIVISHNMPVGNEMSFVELMQLLDGRNLPLALNIKADGMAQEIKKILADFHHTHYFTFDMSIPDMVCQCQAGLNVFTGMSDLLPAPVLLNKAKGIWLDSFNSDWFGSKEINELLAQGKQVCIVSPDLHHRPYKTQWSKYKDLNGIMLCTDYPMEAEEYFNGKN